MTLDELKQRLDRYEWSDVEFKAARSDVPRDAYKTVSAFANTGGGHLVFGIEQSGKQFQIVGVADVDKVQNDFLSVLRGGQLLNRIVCVNESILDDADGRVLVFYVPEMSRREKPVYLSNDIRQSFIRRGGGDEKCTKIEIERFLRDAADTPFDAEPLIGISAEDCFEAASLAWYRRVYQDRNGGKHADLSDVEFLHEFGYVREHEDTLVPTRAGVLLFGCERLVRQTLNRAVVDYQRIAQRVGSEESEVRWDDRMVLEGNLISAWQMLAEKYTQLAAVRFGLDSATLRRSDDPPDYVTFREAVVNLLVHQDFGDSHRMPTIKVFLDEMQLFNPGDAFLTTPELLEAGSKEVRNPTILTAFRHIGLSDQAGSGIRAILREWRNLGHVPPVLDNDRSAKCFRLTLNRASLITQEQRLFQAQLGVKLSEDEARLFAMVCQKDFVDFKDAKACLAKADPEVRKVLSRLQVQELIDPVGGTNNGWALKGHLRKVLFGEPVDDNAGSPEGLVTGGSDQAGSPSASLVTGGGDQAGTPAPRRVLRVLTPAQEQILRFCDVPQRQEAIMAKIGVTHRTHFRNHQLRPLLESGLLVQTHPENPTHPNQAYVVSPSALALLD